MTELDVLRARLEKMERQVRVLGALVLLLACGALAAAVRPRAEVLRGRGLVITDARGHERIVLGAPLSDASANERLAQGVGVAVLDSLGRLSVALGVNNPLVMRGRLSQRLGSDNGLNVYDPRTGDERGGFGVLDDGRANVCLDYAGYKEAACMSVASGDGYAAVMLNGTPKEKQFDRVGLFVGADGRGLVKAFGGGTNESGVMLVGGKGPARVVLTDTTGKPARDLAGQPLP